MALETNPAAVAGGVVARRLEFTYDAGGRRIGKKVYTANGTTWTLASDTRFLYDGWNMVAEASYNTPTATFSLLRSYTWGLDLSGSPQGAGGVGGLLLVKVGTATYAPTYDGNGNIIGAVDTATGTSAAEYEYSAFGETLRATGPAAPAIPFRFSTKFTDSETGLVYYGYRYYQPQTGRWLNKDMLGENGGENLYGFLRNAPIFAVDLLGLLSRTLYFSGQVTLRAKFPVVTTFNHNVNIDYRYWAIVDCPKKGEPFLLKLGLSEGFSELVERPLRIPLSSAPIIDNLAVGETLERIKRLIPSLSAEVKIVSKVTVLGYTIRKVTNYFGENEGYSMELRLNASAATILKDPNLSWDLIFKDANIELNNQNFVSERSFSVSLPFYCECDPTGK